MKLDEHCSRADEQVPEAVITCKLKSHTLHAAGRLTRMINTDDSAPGAAACLSDSATHLFAQVPGQ